jgi:hypothetical protein
VFDGVSDTIRGTQNIGTGEKILTMAMWIKRTAAVNTYDYVCNIGTSTTGQMAGFTINSNKFNFTKYGAQTASTTIINNGQWYHLVGVYKGGNWTTTNAEIYVDGVKETVTGGTTSVLNLTGNQITFGDSTLYDGTADFHGQISQFKLYDTALTAEEVKTLYQMGRCDEGHHVVNFSKTRVGIGLGDGEAPRGALDVRGDFYLPSTTFPNYKFYEEGEFTPFFGAVTAPTFTQQFGRYTKIGNTMLIHVMITYSGLNTGDTSGIHISGIPLHTNPADTNTAIVSYHGQEHTMFTPNLGAGGRIDSGILLLSHATSGSYVKYTDTAASGKVNLTAQFFLS